MLLKRISMASVGVVAAAVGIGLKPMMIANANGSLVASNRANLSAPHAVQSALTKRNPLLVVPSCLICAQISSTRHHDGVILLYDEYGTPDGFL